jgi:N utilization substance protein A
MTVTLSDEARQYIAAFEEVTGATARDCLIYDEDDRLVFLVPPGEMATAIGPDGETVRTLEERLGADVRLVEDADDVEAFVVNTLAPAVVYNVTISENETTVAYVEVADEDKGVAIGAGGRNIEVARDLAERHYDLADVQLT